MQRTDPSKYEKYTYEYFENSATLNIQYFWFDVGELWPQFSFLIIISFKLGYHINENIELTEISHGCLQNVINVTLRDMQYLVLQGYSATTRYISSMV